MGNLTSTWAKDMYPVVLKRFQDRTENKIQLIKANIGYKTLGKNQGLQYQEEGIGGYGVLPDYDGSNLTELNQKRGIVATYTPREKAGEVTVHRKYAVTDMSGEAKKVGTKLSMAITQTQIRSFYNLFAFGWNGSYLGADDKPLFSSTHPINNETGADTFNNTGTTEFSIEGITASQTTAQRFKTYDNLDFDCDFDICYIAPELEPKAKRFFGENAKLLPESAENDANPVEGMKYQVIKGFTAKQWAVADSELMKEYVKMVVISEPEVIPAIQDNPLITKFVGYCDYILGWSDARMIIGHDPA